MDMRNKLACLSVAIAGMLLTPGCLQIDNKTTGNKTYIDVESQPLPGCGIDSKEMRAAADRMARSIVNVPRIAASRTPPRLVLDEKYFRNESTYVVDKALFTDYLRVDLQKASNERFIVLGRNYDDMVEEERSDAEYGMVTEGAVVKKASKRLGWDYRLGGAIRSITKVIPSTGERSGYFLITFELIERGTGRVIWSDRHEFKKVSSRSAIYR